MLPGRMPIQQSCADAAPDAKRGSDYAAAMGVAARELQELERVDRVVVFGASVLAQVCIVYPPSGFQYRPSQSRVYGLET